MFPLFRDYKIDPEDKGEFMAHHEIPDDADFSGSCQIYSFDKKKDNPKPHLKYFCRVGGGYQGFKYKRNANNFLKQPD